MNHTKDSLAALDQVLIEDHGYTAQDLFKLDVQAALEADLLILEDE